MNDIQPNTLVPLGALEFFNGTTYEGTEVEFVRLRPYVSRTSDATLISILDPFNLYILNTSNEGRSPLLDADFVCLTNVTNTTVFRCVGSYENALAPQGAILYGTFRPSFEAIIASSMLADGEMAADAEPAPEFPYTLEIAGFGSPFGGAVLTDGVPTEVPEPVSAALLAVGTVAICSMHRWRTSRLPPV